MTYVYSYHVVGDELIIGRGHENYRQNFFKLDLPFSQKSRKGDFKYYAPKNSVLPNPFTSVNDFIPKSRLEALLEFAFYPSCWSTLH